MKLYHFTARHLLEGCKAKGLILGCVPWIGASGKLELINGYQWLTTNPEYQQEWCNPEFSNLEYRRNAVRITVEIPLCFAKRVKQWLAFCKGNTLAKDLNAFGDPQNWRLFKGAVSASWFTAIDFNPSETSTL